MALSCLRCGVAVDRLRDRARVVAGRVATVCRPCAGEADGPVTSAAKLALCADCGIAVEAWQARPIVGQAGVRLRCPVCADLPVKPERPPTAASPPPPGARGGTALPPPSRARAVGLWGATAASAACLLVAWLGRPGEPSRQTVATLAGGMHASLATTAIGDALVAPVADAVGARVPAAAARSALATAAKSPAPTALATRAAAIRPPPTTAAAPEDAAPRPLLAMRGASVATVDRAVLADGEAPVVVPAPGRNGEPAEERPEHEPPVDERSVDENPDDGTPADDILAEAVRDADVHREAHDDDDPVDDADDPLAGDDELEHPDAHELALVHPLPGPERTLPVTHGGRFGAERPGRRARECRRGHCGVDLRAPEGTPVLAARDGVVGRISTVDKEVGGRYVRLEHDDGSTTWYMHLDRVRPDLAVGLRVRAGEVIATLGRSGVRYSATHLHFALTRPVRGRVRYVDPLPFLARALVTPAPEMPAELAGGAIADVPDEVE